MLDADSALALYRAARAADPDYLPAQIEYIGRMYERFRWPDLHREFAITRTPSAFRACLEAATVAQGTTGRPGALLVALEHRVGISLCTDLFLLSWDVRARDRLPRAARAAREAPLLSSVWSNYAERLKAAGRKREAELALREGLAHVDDPIARLSLQLQLFRLHLERADTARAVALANAAAAAVRRDGRPGVRSAHLVQVCSGGWAFGPIAPARELACRQWVVGARAHHAWLVEWYASRSIGRGLLDRGEVAPALPYLDRTVALADSVGTPGLRLVSYMLRGRAYSKLGRFAPAVRDLRRAIGAGAAAEDPYYLAEAYHNLAHTYEGAGDFAAAAGAADTFAATTTLLAQTDELRMMSRHDAGMIRWEAGWHAAADRDFAAMVRLVDEQDTQQYYAGEYFERIGDLGRALRYYRVGPRRWHDTRSLVALTRLYEALGLADSAAAAARLHDAWSDTWTPLEGPLLPGVLAKQGRLAEAVALADTWARHELATGNVQGAAIADLRAAELHLADHQPDSARAAAARADTLSRVLTLRDEAIQARTLEGQALVEAGMTSQGLAALREAAALARAHPTVEGQLQAYLALGHALEASGARTAAAVAYDRAAAPVERMTAGLETDPDRTGFRAEHLAPFDGALRILLRTAPSADVEAALRWSARRKGAALALAGVPAGVALNPPSVLQLRARLGPDEALIDYTVLDSTVTAIVVGRRGASLVPIPASLAQLDAWTDAVRRPLVATPGGRVDLAHARFDVAAAERLFQALVTPLEGVLAGAHRLAIVPDAVLWYVPFAALVIPPSADAASAGPSPEYLIDRYEVRLLPSTQFLLGATAGSAMRPGFRVLALSYAVPGGAAELAAVRGALGEGRVLTREGGAATERAALTASAEVLHLAVHSLVDDRDPLASHLRLAPQGTDDGLLHLSEIAGRRLAPRLVVLSACEGVNGRLYAGEGLVGLARAFLVGGTRQVVASEWPVDSSAAGLMGAFYGQLERGIRPAAALRAAQLMLRMQPATAHPIHWAGFVVFEGDAARGRGAGPNPTAN